MKKKELDVQELWEKFVPQLKKFKDLKIIVCAFLFIICMINSPWITLSLVGLSYIISLPLSIRAWMNEKDLNKNSSDTLEI